MSVLPTVLGDMVEKLGEYDFDGILTTASAYSATAYGLISLLGMAALAYSNFANNKNPTKYTLAKNAIWYRDEKLDQLERSLNKNNFLENWAEERFSEDPSRRVLVLPVTVQPEYDSLIGKNTSIFVEMVYFALKYLGDFEKINGWGRDSSSFSSKSEAETSLLSDNTTNALKMIRYSAKFIKNFEKLIQD